MSASKMTAPIPSTPQKRTTKPVTISQATGNSHEKTNSRVVSQIPTTPLPAPLLFDPSAPKRPFATPIYRLSKPPTDVEIIENPKFVQSKKSDEVRPPLSMKQIFFNDPFIVFVLDKCCKPTFIVEGEKYSFQMCKKCAMRNRQARFLSPGY